LDRATRVDAGHAEVGAFVLERQRDSAAPGADVGDARGQLESDLHEQLGLGPRDQDARVDVKHEPPEALGAEDVRDRLAAQTACQQLLVARPCGRLELGAGSDIERRPLDSKRRC
jgi:hypothetical protein